MSAQIARLCKLIFDVKLKHFDLAAGVTAADLPLALDLHAKTMANCKLITIVFILVNVEKRV
jgi:hypothetical protein